MADLRSVASANIPENDQIFGLTTPKPGSETSVSVVIASQISESDVR